MTETYARMPRALAPAVRDALMTLSSPNPDASRMLVHCTAGKDRTGFVCAMVLSALDVPQESILEDYLESSRRKPPETLARSLLDYHHIPIDTRALGAMIQIAAVWPDYLDTAFKTTIEQFGSVADYLKHCGLDNARREALRTALLS
jgi:protein-tyrosine phosphatase